MPGCPDSVGLGEGQITSVSQAFLELLLRGAFSDLLAQTRPASLRHLVDVYSNSSAAAASTSASLRCRAFGLGSWVEHGWGMG